MERGADVWAAPLSGVRGCSAVEASSASARARSAASAASWAVAAELDPVRDRREREGSNQEADPAPPTSLDGVIRNPNTGAVTATRPICMYPNTAAYVGTGDTTVASSFTCRPSSAGP